MALWGKTDTANAAPFYAPAQKKVDATANSAAAMYGNTSFGVFAADDNEVKATPGIAHAGWQLRTEGTGGRAGRVHYETLVALSSVTSDGADDATLDDNVITVLAPSAQTVAAPAATTFVATAESEPAGTVVYQWQMSTGGAYSDLEDLGVYSGTDTDTLAISDTTGLNGNRFRVIVSEATGNADSVTTTGVVLTVT